MILRQLKSEIESDFFSGKVIVILGARQLGKTTLIESIVKHRNEGTIVF